MKILVIGSKGFIGASVLFYYQNQKDDEVYGADVVTDYSADNYFLIDASNSNFDDLFSKINFDICINCSGAASVPDSLLHPLRDFFLNTKNVALILEAIRKHSPDCKLLNLSSAAVYGSPKVLPIREDQPATPLSPYGWHKYQSELLCKEYYQIFNIKTCSARIFSAYGPGLKKQIFWDWMQKVKKESEIVLWGTGNESRDFIFISDVVKAIDCIRKNGKFTGEVINVANGQETMIHEAIRIFSEFSDIKFKYSFNNIVREGDPTNWVANIDLLNSLGYYPSITLENGIKKIFEWVKEEK